MDRRVDYFASETHITEALSSQAHRHRKWVRGHSNVGKRRHEAAPHARALVAVVHGSFSARSAIATNPPCTEKWNSNHRGRRPPQRKFQTSSPKSFPRPRINQPTSFRTTRGLCVCKQGGFSLISLLVCRQETSPVVQKKIFSGLWINQPTW